MKEDMAEQLSRIFQRPIPPNEKRKEKISHEERPITDKSFNIGSVLKMKLDESDGLVLRDKYDTRRKYFVVLGEVIDDGIIGVFLINSDINKNVLNTKGLVDSQVTLTKDNYPKILDYDSLLDCSDILEINKNKIRDIGKQIGELKTSDKKIVIDTIEKSEIITPKQKKRLGFEDKS